ncbi:Hint domain-containing protein [Primorskyibacter marinus]|uniref:Hint domain-containing protein n=1 Tax=Primorskyibacter marinus TaxID=1977320 RepID=UPI001E2E9D16|nr:Hint domain-containing protein [Primorskyibacter marinus]
MATTFTVFSLGVMPIWDPVEGNNLVSTVAVNQSLGTYGSASDPLSFDRHEFSPAGNGFSGGAAGAYDTDNNVSNDQFSIDGGAPQTHDATMLFNATITYEDGTTADISAVLFQDTLGNTYWAPETSANADQAAINAQPIQSLELLSPIYANGSTNEAYNLAADRQDTLPLCFSKGALVGCPCGERPVESLAAGDLVLTRDHGAVPIRWVGHRKLSKTELDANPKLRPVRILAGALGDGFPTRDLVVSRQHRVLVQSKIAKRMFGAAEVLIPAIKLTELPGIFIDDAFDVVEYYHILLDTHEILHVEGTGAESLLTGPEALKSVGPDAREEILTILPQIADLKYIPKSARLIPSGPQQKKLIARHLKNKKDLLNRHL